MADLWTAFDTKTEAECFFREFLQHKPHDYTGITVEVWERVLPYRCSEIELAQRTKEVIAEEIREVLFAMPSEKSIQATLHPVITDALYFVAKGDGTHKFSSSLTEHNKAVTNYQIDMVLPNIGKKAEKTKCPQPWYIPDTLKSLFSINCQIQ